MYSFNFSSLTFEELMFIINVKYNNNIFDMRGKFDLSTFNKKESCRYMLEEINVDNTHIIRIMNKISLTTHTFYYINCVSGMLFKVKKAVLNDDILINLKNDWDHIEN